MFEIMQKKQISPKGFFMRINAPQVAQRARPGQFLILRVNETGERIPLTIVNWSRSRGFVDIAFQVVGKTTFLLSQLREGDTIIDLLGPLGQPSKIENYGTVLFLAGGFGAAAVFPIARAMKRKGNRVLTILGARNKDHLIFEKELKKISNLLLITTDDGSKGIKGFVKDGLPEILNSEKIDIAYCIGPAVMMKFTSEETRKHSIPTIVSLNPIMVDGTGMCGSCRVEVGGRTYFACVDGPEFDAHLVNWDLLISRLNYYKDEEKLAYESIFKER